MTQRPEVFVNATTADLGSCRKAIQDALLTLGCVPVEQTTFPPDGASVRAMLRRRISDLEAEAAGLERGAGGRQRTVSRASRRRRRWSRWAGR